MKMKYFSNLSNCVNFIQYYKINRLMPWYQIARFKHNVIFFGSDEIALKSLQKINNLRILKNIIGRLDLVTANRSNKPSAIEKFAVEQSLDVLKWPIKITDSKYSLGVVVSFGHLIPKEVIEAFHLGVVNMHPSLLPRWRGAAPIVHTLLNGDRKTGVTLMKIKPHEFDVGEIISQEIVEVGEHTLLPELINLLSDLGAEMLARFIEDLPESISKTQPQPTDGVTYAKKISKNVAKVNWMKMTSLQIYNLYRATYGLYNLTSTFGNKEVKLFDAFLDNTTKEVDSALPIGHVVYCKELDAIKVLCKDRKYICFRHLRLVGKRKISACDFYNGYLKKTCTDSRVYMLS